MAEHDMQSSAGPDRSAPHGDERFPGAFGEGYVHVDERSFENLLASIADYSKKLKYYNHQNQEDGDWSRLLLHDEVVIMAIIISFDLSSIVSQFNRLPQASTMDGFRLTQKLALALHDWHECLASISYGSLHSPDPAAVGEQLRSKFAAIYGDDAFGKVCNEKLRYPQDYEGINLSEHFHRWANFAQNLKAWCREHIDTALKSGKHDPAVGLLLAFLKMYQTSQQMLNTFTRNHLQFYYETCLGSVPLPGNPNSSHIVFTSASENPVIIEKGTAFTPDNKKNGLAYTSDADLMVSNAAIRSMFILSFLQNKLICPAKDHQWITEAFLGTPPADALDTSKAHTAESWPLFGACETAHKTLNSSPAEIGFCVASPVLNMQEGTRKVTMLIQLQSKGTDSLDKVDKYCKKHKKDLHSYLQNAFLISFTTEDGWHSTTPSTIDIAPNENRIKVEVSLPPLVAAVIPWNEELHGNDFQANAPVMQVILNPEANLYMYSVLEPCEIESIDLEVAVKGASHLQISNQNGPLDNSNTFLPFGPVPSKDSYITIGSYETAIKTITHIDFTITWSNLPDSPGGFEEYYRDYGTSALNKEFLVDFSYLKDAHWVPFKKNAVDNHLLFRTEPGISRLAPTSTFTIRNPYLMKPIQMHQPESKYRYDAHSVEGFLRLTFSPESASFGFKEYPAILNEVLTENVKRKIKKKQPNPPYAPSVSRISMNYTAKASILFSSQQDDAGKGFSEMFFLKAPFALQQLYPGSLQNNASLLPQYKPGGYLHIQITASTLPERLALLFLLRDDSAFASKPVDNNISWAYRDKGVWKDLPKTFVTRDDTEGFLSSGIVELNLLLLDVDDTLKENGDFWLRIHASKHAFSYCSCHGVYPHGLKVTRTEGPETGTPSGPLKPAKILAGINSMVQADDYFGGTAHETEKHMQIRVSERLRHKNRAWTPWDYEQLILGEFPYLAFVKCFPNMRTGVKPYKKAGYILIVASPSLTDNTAGSTYYPKLNAVTLRQIQTFICKRTSCFVQEEHLEVRNPAYDRITVKCTVMFTDSGFGGANEKQLHRDIEAYVSPWHPEGLHQKFGWQLRIPEFVAYLQSKQYVKFITGLSIVKISLPDSKNREFFESTDDSASHITCMYDILDTANQDTTTDKNIVRPTYPWSTAVPAEKHLITVINSNNNIKPHGQNKTGIEELEIGSSFIIGENIKS